MPYVETKMDSQSAIIESNDADDYLDDPRLSAYAKTSGHTEKQVFAPDTKKLTQNLIEAVSIMERAKRDYIFSVVSLGEKLIEAKQIIGFGKWEEFLNANSELAFGRIQAGKYMQIARHKDLVIALFNDGNVRPSVNQITKAISAANAPAPGNDARKNADDDAVIEKVMIADNHSPGKAGQEEVIEGEFVEVKPEPKPSGLPPPDPEPEQSIDDADINVLKDVIHELQSQIDELTAENEQMRVVFDDDNHIAAAMKEVKKLTEDNRVLKERNNGLMSEKNDAIRSVKHWKRKAEQLEKQIQEMSHE